MSTSPAAGDRDYRVYDQGWDEGQAAIMEAPVCSACGANHDADESSMCDDGEVVSFKEWVDAQR